jgi:GNAT superfamily N-acetyltransferase
MEQKYSVSRNAASIEAAIAIIKEAHLYVDGWRFWDWMETPSNIRYIVLCHMNGEAVGAGIIYAEVWECQPNAGVFVHPSYRKNGIGKEILRKLEQQEISLRTNYGEYGSLDFFRKCQNDGIKFDMLQWG